MEGVSLYFNDEAQALCLFTHHIADPLKRSKKFRREIAADFPPLGERDPRFREEHDMDFDVQHDRLLYYAYSPSYNLVEPFPILERGFSHLFNIFDMGDQTAILFTAQNPVTQQSVIWKELYPYRESVATMQRRCHEVMAEHLGMGIGSFRYNDQFEDVFSDIHAGSIAREFGEGELAISIRTRGIRTADGSRLDDHVRGFRRANELLAPGFWHCGKRQHPRDPVTGAYALAGRCHFCGARPIEAAPLLLIFDGPEACPNLIRTLPDQVKESPPEGHAETDKEKRGLEDHLPDCVRYYAQRVVVREQRQHARESMLDKPVADLTAPERVTRILERHLEQQQEDFAAGVRFEDGAYIETDAGMVRVHDFDTQDPGGWGTYDDD